jgi:enoyl-CoA hydratase/carnithine racemase
MSITCTQTDGVAILAIDRPHRRNALSMPEWHALRDHARALADAEGLRAVILHGRHGHFCAGMDLRPDNPLMARVQKAVFQGERDVGVDVILELKECLAAIAALPVPVVAAIEGACAGGGLEVALVADMRVASSDAFFSLPETRVGMVPDLGGSARLTHLVGRSRAAWLALSGRRLDAGDAKTWGLCEQVCAPGQALETAHALVADICKGGPIATRLALQAIRFASAHPLDAALDNETQAGASALVSGEVPIGVMAFVQRKEPDWG